MIEAVSARDVHEGGVIQSDFKTETRNVLFFLVWVCRKCGERQARLRSFSEVCSGVRVLKSDVVEPEFLVGQPN